MLRCGGILPRPVDLLRNDIRQIQKFKEEAVLANYQAPGVYIEEVPGARSISGVSTDIAAFVGITERGPYHRPTLVTGWDEFRDKFGGFIWNRFLPLAVYNFFTERGARCYIVRSQLPAGFAAGSVLFGEAGDDKQNIGFTATSAGDWSNNLSISMVQNADGASFSVQFIQKQPTNLTGEQSLSLLMTDRYVQANDMPPAADDAGARVVESFDGFTLADLINDTSGTSNLMRRVNGTSLLFRVKTNGYAMGAAIPASETKTCENGNGASTDVSYTTALNALDPITDFSTIAIPDTVDQTTYKVVAGDGEDYWDWEIASVESSKSKNAALDLIGKTEGWKHAFSLTDPPYGLQVIGNSVEKPGVLGYKTGQYDNLAINSSYAALYYPWTLVSNPYTGKSLWVPPSGQSLGRYSATDRSIGVWKAPAGVEDGKLLTAAKLELDMTGVQQESLNPQGIDAIRSILDYGIVIYGARTTSLDPEWRYVPVRRLAIFIEQSLYNALQWVVFEPNSPGLWGRVTRDVSNFMTNLWRQGALFGTSAAEAFFVTCDASNNPPETRDEGYLFIDVGFAPVKPAEFVVIRLAQITLTA